MPIAARLGLLGAISLIAFSQTGCNMVPRNQLASAQNRTRQLYGQNKSLATDRQGLLNQNQQLQRRIPALEELALFKCLSDDERTQLAGRLKEAPFAKGETLTRQGDFTLKKFTPQDFVPKEFYAEWPIDIALDGTYHNLALFFDRMSRFSRIINVEALRVSELRDVPQKSISATFTAKTFIYTGDEAATTAGGQPPPGTPAAPAAVSARKLKERAEGKGIE